MNLHEAQMQRYAGAAHTEIEKLRAERAELRQRLADVLKFVDYAMYQKKIDPGFFIIGIDKARAALNKERPE
jgi:hypothetical protein